MAKVRNNIATNLVAGVWATVLTAAITPLQVNLLGIEAYGIIGFIATLQIVFAAFDLGLSSTLTREIAADSSEGRTRAGELIGTATTIYWSCAALIGGTLALLAGTIARGWFNPVTLTTGQIENALYLIVLYLALRWPIALYTGVLAGVQRMVAINLVKIVAITLRLAGGLIVILLWRDIQAFLLWNALVALAEVAAYFEVARRAVPAVARRPGFSIPAIRSVIGFSGVMMAISLLALFISQLDRILISKMLTLEQFGYYNLAFSAASITSLAIAAVATAMLPSFASWQTNPQLDVLQSRYEHANRAILFIVGGASFALIFFGKAVLSVWIGSHAAEAAYAPMAILAGGFWLNAVISNAYTVTVALGRPGLSLRVSAASALPYAVALYLLISWYGTVGAALAWLALNLCYVAVLVPIVHRALLHVSTADWLARTILPFAALGIATFGVARLIAGQLPAADALPIQLAAAVAGGLAYAGFGYRLLGRRIQAELAAIAGARRAAL